MFSKMSGIQEWANAIFLFVNLESGVENLWLDAGRQLVWFAQHRQTVASAQVQRLIHHALGTRYPPPSAPQHLPGSAGGDDPTAAPPSTVFLTPCAVALVCRSTADPYIWCGSLRYVSHDPASHPLRFVWALEDYDALVSRPGSLFPALLTAAAAPHAPA